jgi:cytochrome P450
MLNLTTIVLQKYQAATDLLEYRSSLYANRPDIWMVTELGERKNSVFWMKSSNPRFKLTRRLLHKTLNPNVLGTWESIQMQEVKTLLQGLRQSPDDFLAHLRR